MIRYKFKEGDTVCFDPYNKTRQKVAATAYILQVVGRYRSGFVKRYICISNQTGRKYHIKESLLAPYKFMENNVFIRFPEDAPEIDYIDISCIEALLNICKLDQNQKLYKDVKAVIAKLKYYEKQNDV